MTTRETLDRLTAGLPESRLEQLVEYARFLAWQEEREEWRQFGQGQLAQAYGKDEPEYTEADILPEETT
jgi:hypothetical protein